MFHRNPEPWSLVELYAALDKIICVKPRACFCFFIDGLDEFTGDANQQGVLAERIQELASSPSVKICVASRPWTAFDNVFGGDDRRKLTLEHLTRDDMDKYVRGMLEENARFTALLRKDPAASSLVHEIRDKAQGVFLWVTLVVKSLLSGLTQHDGLEELQNRLQTLQSDLRAFFARMLESIEDNYRIYAARILSLALCSTPLPLMTFWWIRLEVKEPEYAVSAAVENISQNVRQTKTARACVNKWAKDLLAVYDTGEGSNSTGDMADLKIDFLHRTVGDFLNEPEVCDQLRIQSGPDFDPDQSMCRIFLAEAKTMQISRLAESFVTKGFEAIAYCMVSHAKQYEAQHSHPLTALLKSLDGVFTERLAPIDNCLSQHWTASMAGSRHVATSTFHRKTVSNKSSNFLAYAVANNLVEFVRDTLDTSPQQLHKPGRPLLDFALYPTFPEPGFSRLSRDTGFFKEMVKLLLERKALPNDRANVLGVMSVWQLFLLDIHACKEDTVQPRAGAWEMAQLLLRYKADPQAKIPVEQIRSSVDIKHDPREDGQDLTLQRKDTRFASVEDCLLCIERHENVRDVLSNLPASSNVWAWSSWRPWFL